MVSRLFKSIFSGILGVVAISLSFSLYIIWTNPLFVDSLLLYIIFFLFIPAILGAIVGLILFPFTYLSRKAANPAHNSTKESLTTYFKSRKAFFVFSFIAGMFVLVVVISFTSNMLTNSDTTNCTKMQLIGVDGATWNVINPLIKEGKMPNLDRLISEGTSGILKSMLPSLSPRLWTSIATGKLPQKHGVQNFFSTQKSLKVKRIWKIFEDAGKNIGIVSWMITWPPDVKNGYLIPSYTLARGIETVPEEFEFIQDLIMTKRFEKDSGLFQMIKWGLNGMRRGLRLSTMIAALDEFSFVITQQPKYLDKSYREQQLVLKFYRDVYFNLKNMFNPFFSAIVFYGSDNLAHRYWQFYEPQLFKDVSDEEIEKYKNAIPDYYMLVDKAVGEIIDRSCKDTNIIIVSDHGTKANEDKNIWFPRLATDLLMKQLQKDKYVEITNIGNNSIINLKKKFSGEHPGMLKEIKELLENITFVFNNEKVFKVQLHDIEGELGDYVGVRFEIIPETITLDSKLRLPDGRTIKIEDLVNLKLSFEISGVHDLNGIFIAKGPHIKKKTEISGAEILDVTPTLLYLAGMPIGKDMDGKVLTDIIEADYLDNNPVEYIETYETGDVREKAPDAPLSEGVKDRLRSLGYLN